jgi:hypothetical protein
MAQRPGAPHRRVSSRRTRCGRRAAESRESLRRWAKLPVNAQHVVQLSGFIGRQVRADHLIPEVDISVVSDGTRLGPRNGLLDK